MMTNPKMTVILLQHKELLVSFCQIHNCWNRSKQCPMWKYYAPRIGLNKNKIINDNGNWWKVQSSHVIVCLLDVWHKCCHVRGTMAIVGLAMCSFDVHLPSPHASCARIDMARSICSISSCFTKWTMCNDVLPSCSTTLLYRNGSLFGHLVLCSTLVRVLPLSTSSSSLAHVLFDKCVRAFHLC